MREWKTWHQIAGVEMENSGVENERVEYVIWRGTASKFFVQRKSAICLTTNDKPVSRYDNGTVRDSEPVFPSVLWYCCLLTCKTVSQITYKRRQWALHGCSHRGIVTNCRQQQQQQQRRGWNVWGVISDKVRAVRIASDSFISYVCIKRTMQKNCPIVACSLLYSDGSNALLCCVNQWSISVQSSTVWRPMKLRLLLDQFRLSVRLSVTRRSTAKTVRDKPRRMVTMGSLSGVAPGVQFLAIGPPSHAEIIPVRATKCGTTNARRWLRLSTPRKSSGCGPQTSFSIRTEIYMTAWPTINYQRPPPIQVGGGGALWRITRWTF